MRVEHAHPQHFWLRGEEPSAPIEFDEATGVWNVYGHPETVQVVSDPATFSSDATRLVPLDEGSDEDVKAFTEGNLVQMDPPDHRKLRTLVSHAFTPKMVAGLEPRIREITAGLLDAAAAGGRFEMVADLAYPLPVIVIADLLGVPAADRELFKKWADGLTGTTAELSLTNMSEEQRKEFRSQLDVTREMQDYLRVHAAERRSRPREDLLTKLVQAEVDGERLSDNEVVNFAGLLLLAGHITTTLLLGNTVLCLDAHPEQARQVRADRAAVPTAIEESLRLLTPFAAIVRVTNRDVEIGGRHVPKDQMLMVWLGAANRDARQFDRPHEFDARRDPNPHLGFGRGIHFCLGAPLARLEGRVVLNMLLDRFPELQTDPAAPPEFLAGWDTIGVRSLPLLTG
jgi:cytochrome P450